MFDTQPPLRYDWLLLAQIYLRERAMYQTEKTPFIARPPSPTRGNDEKTIRLNSHETFTLTDKFFKEVIATKSSIEDRDIVFIIINHVVPTLPPFLRAIERIGKIAVVIPKQSHRDEAVFAEIQKNYTMADSHVTREWLAQENHAVEFIGSYVKADENFLIIDIGGYFASPLPKISRELKEKFIGIVEDTENGHQKYEKILREVGSPLCPLASVARCALKETEDYNVGKSIVEGAGIILRTDSHTMLERMKTIGVIGFGKIGSSRVS